MRFAISLPNVGDPAALVALGEQAERRGWDGVLCGTTCSCSGPWTSTWSTLWVVLGAMAVRTERVRLGTLVTPLPRRRPWKLAKEVPTLDHLSGGRAVLGVGIGFPPDDEYAAFGEESGERARADVPDEALQLVDRFLAGEPVTHDGAHFRVDAHLRPAAVQQSRPPVWVTAMAPNRRPPRRAVQWDGAVPIASDGEPLTPDRLAAYLDGVERRPG